jgi:hypothetical protein
VPTFGVARWIIWFAAATLNWLRCTPSLQLFPKLTLPASLESPVFEECGDKKSQILKQQNLASEEGDEKLME